jgi:hypothetical protein
MVVALSRIESNFLDKIKEMSKLDTTYLKLAEQVKEGIVRWYWLEDGLLYTNGHRLYIPIGGLQRDLLKESHDSKWVGHPGMERMYALLSRSYYWPGMREEVELYMRTCLVCQQGKVE